MAKRRTLGNQMTISQMQRNSLMYSIVFIPMHPDMLTWLAYGLRKYSRTTSCFSYLNDLEKSYWKKAKSQDLNGKLFIVETTILKKGVVL